MGRQRLLMLLRVVVAMAAAASTLGTASPAGAGAPDNCAQHVIRDWYSGGRVDRLYPLPCYRAAIRALPDDVLQYSDASAAIERAHPPARLATGPVEKTPAPGIPYPLIALGCSRRCCS